VRLSRKLSQARARSPPGTLSSELPALLLFLGIVIAPILMTILLSFNQWNSAQGIQNVFVLSNWREVLSDSYFSEMFLRTFRLAGLVTLLTVVIGAPEAYILNRMGRRWKSTCLLVILRAAADFGRGAHAWMGAAVRRQQRRD